MTDYSTRCQLNQATSNSHFEHNAQTRDNETIELAVPGGQMAVFSHASRPRNAVFDSQQVVELNIMFKMRIADQATDCVARAQDMLRG